MSGDPHSVMDTGLREVCTRSVSQLKSRAPGGFLLLFPPKFSCRRPIFFWPAPLLWKGAELKTISRRN
ncbi:hypothetical protein IF1G_09106 [Cordyceps javanica]|uniref:Uncharacterized protein n=1 Tax=Cordyceps javanica TaxID=43265 RepID=A0A545URE4_9HYPO|nr:hypothetical protein IF1G_09106 [Cordyceps javanica]